MKRNRSQIGFSLLETLLYFGLASTIFVVVTMFFAVTLQTRVKIETMSAVEQTGVQIIDEITQKVRNATSITSPGVGATTGVLQVPSLDAAANPVYIDVAQGVVRIKEGTGTPVALNATDLAVTNLQFINMSRSGTPGTLRFSFTISKVNPRNRPEFNYSKTFYASATIK